MRDLVRMSLSAGRLGRFERCAAKLEVIFAARSFTPLSLPVYRVLPGRHASQAAAEQRPFVRNARDVLAKGPSSVSTVAHLFDQIDCECVGWTCPLSVGPRTVERVNAIPPHEVM